MVDPTQYSLSLIPHRYENELIQQRTIDGYINATAMCNAAEKLFGDYSRLKSSNLFLDELSTDMGIPISGLIQSVKGGAVQGTWVHPHVAIHLAQWLSPKFAVQVSKWVFDWMSGLGIPSQTSRSTPIFVRRFNENWDRVSPGYFSIISELFIRIYGRLEQAGHVLSDKASDGKEVRPDVSVGQIFPKWLEENYPELADRYELYNHVLPNKVIVDARQYENAVLPAFIEFIEAEWLPKRAGMYFQKRDPKALEYLPKLLSNSAVP